jgi:hypothetical protein
LDLKLQEYYESLLNLFTTDGWKKFQEDMDNSLKTLNDTQSINTAEEFWLRKGQVQTLSFIVNYENAAKAAYEDLAHVESV